MHTVPCTLCLAHCTLHTLSCTLCLAQVAAALALEEAATTASVELENARLQEFSDRPRLLPMVRQDDIFVTGILAERLPVHLTDLSPGTPGKIWDLVFSQCPLLATIRQLFFNRIVLRKGPTSLPYVNGPKFFLCCCLESQLTSLESLAPPFIVHLLQPLWQICART